MVANLPRALVVASILIASLAAPNVVGHGERYTEFPPGGNEVPMYRESGPYFITCKEDTPDRLAGADFDKRMDELLRFVECQDSGFEHLQAAVDAVPARGWTIYMQPGLYLEEPSKDAWENPPEGCEGLSETRQLDSYEQHLQCPNAHNTVAILGDRDGDRICGTSEEEVLCDLQIEGTGVSREDVIVDAEWKHLNAIRADRADGFYIKHITAQRTDFNSIYILETDGFVIDDVLTRWNYEYGFLTFAVDHGLYTDCESYGNGDSGIYPGSAADLHQERHSIEIRFCDSHHNALGYSGTAGNSVWAHDNDFHHNTAGVAMDSLYPGHPGLPQDSARFENNKIYSNNINYHDNWLPDGPCHRPLAERGIEDGVVCPVVPVPVGTGFLIAGGNDNTFEGNQVWDNWRYGGMLFTVPAAFRDETAPESQFDTSHRNSFLGNFMGIDPDGNRDVNGQDWWWDESGEGNCWAGNVYADGDEPRHNQERPQEFIAVYPVCGENEEFNSAQRPPHARLATIAPCAEHSVPDNTHPEGCEWMESVEEPQ